MTRISSALSVLVSIVLVGGGCSDDGKNGTATSSAGTGDSSTVTKTIEVAVEGSIDDPGDRVFAVTYFYSSELGPEELGQALTSVFGDGGEPPASLVIGIAGMCGPNGYSDKIVEATGFPVEPVNAQLCNDDGAPFTVSLEIPAGATLHYSVDTGLVSDMDNTETFAGNHVGSPNDPPTAEDFEIVDADNTTSFTYSFDGG